MQARGRGGILQCQAQAGGSHNSKPDGPDATHAHRRPQPGAVVPPRLRRRAWRHLCRRCLVVSRRVRKPNRAAFGQRLTIRGRCFASSAIQPAALKTRQIDSKWTGKSWPPSGFDSVSATKIIDLRAFPQSAVTRNAPAVSPALRQQRGQTPILQLRTHKPAG